MSELRTREANLPLEGDFSRLAQAAKSFGGRAWPIGGWLSALSRCFWRPASSLKYSTEERARSASHRL